MKSDALIKRYAGLYGEERKYEAFGAACCGSAHGRYVDRLRLLLRQSVKNDLENERYVLQIPQEDIFGILWALAGNSTDGKGKEWMSLVQQVSFFCQIRF
jgi:hypothetical protein